MHSRQFSTGLAVGLDVVDVVLSAVDVVAVGRCLRAGRVEIHDRLAQLAVGIPCCQENLPNLGGGVHV